MDDSDEDRYLLKRYLRKTGLSLDVFEASDGQEGIDLLTMPLSEIKAQHPSIEAPLILFLDINMPLMSGWEFVNELDSRREEVSLNPTVVIMHSTGDSQYESHKIEDFKCIAGYVVKGDASPDNLRAAILDATAKA